MTLCDTAAEDTSVNMKLKAEATYTHSICTWLLYGNEALAGIFPYLIEKELQKPHIVYEIKCKRTQCVPKLLTSTAY